MAARKSAKRKSRPAKAKARKPVRAKPAKAKKAAPKKSARRKPVVRRKAKGASQPDIAVGVEHLARIIAEAKRDLAALSAQDIRAKHLPTAGDELTAIVGATERATNAILDAVERIEKSANAAGGETGSAILADVTSIYEAWQFPGHHRPAHLEDRERAEGSRPDGRGPARGDEPAGRGDQCGVASAGPERTGEDALLNGPQMPDAAPNQADIDALFDKA